MYCFPQTIWSAIHITVALFAKILQDNLCQFVIYKEIEITFKRFMETQQKLSNAPQKKKSFNFFFTHPIPHAVLESSERWRKKELDYV